MRKEILIVHVLHYYNAAPDIINNQEPTKHRKGIEGVELETAFVVEVEATIEREEFADDFDRQITLGESVTDFKFIRAAVQTTLHLQNSNVFPSAWQGIQDPSKAFDAGIISDITDELNAVIAGNSKEVEFPIIPSVTICEPCKTA